MTKKVAVIGTRGIPAEYGGIEKHCEDLYSNLIKTGYEIVIYTRNPHAKNNSYQFNGIKIINIPVPDIKGVEAFLYSFAATVMATVSNVNIIHFHAQGPALFSFIPRLFAPKKKVLFTCHGIDWKRDKWNLLAKMIILLGEKASAVFPHSKIVVAKNLAEYYADKYNSKTTIIFSATDIKHKIQLNNCKSKFNILKNNYFLCIGRLVPEKSPETIIKAMKEIKEDIKLVIAGQESEIDPYLKELKKLAKNDNRIIFTGYVNNEELKELYSNALAYISASKLEGLPLCLLEAMSYATPVIISDIPPHKEVFNLDREAIITFKVNDINSCKNAMDKILSKSSKERKNLGISCQNLIKDHFCINTLIKKTEKIYENVLK